MMMRHTSGPEWAFRLGRMSVYSERQLKHVAPSKACDARVRRACRVPSLVLHATLASGELVEMLQGAPVCCKALLRCCKALLRGPGKAQVRGTRPTGDGLKDLKTLRPPRAAHPGGHQGLPIQAVCGTRPTDGGQPMAANRWRVCGTRPTDGQPGPDQGLYVYLQGLFPTELATKVWPVPSKPYPPAAEYQALFSTVPRPPCNVPSSRGARPRQEEAIRGEAIRYHGPFGRGRKHLVRTLRLRLVCSVPVC